MSQIKLTGKDPSTVQNPDVGQKRFFLDSTASNDLSYKDEFGSVVNLETTLSPSKNIREISADYTVDASDNGNIIELITASVVNVTFPAGLGGGFNVELVTRLPDSVIFPIAGSGAAMSLKGTGTGIQGQANKAFVYHSGTESALDQYVACEDISQVATSPDEISGLSLWVDFSDASTITLDGTELTQITDKSTNAMTLSPLDTNRRPEIIPLAQNGLQAAEFNEDVIETDTFIDSWSGAFTIYYAGNFFSVADNRLIAAAGISGGSSVISGFVQRSPTQLRQFTRGQQSNELVNPPGLSNPALGRHRFDGTTGNVLLENSSATSIDQPTSVGSLTTQDAFLIGGRGNQTNFIEGYMFEVISFNRALTDLEDNLVRAYLIQKWGL